MKRLIPYLADHPWGVLLVLAVITLAAATQLGKLRTTISAEGMMITDAGPRAFYKHALDTFGSDYTTLIFLGDPALFDKHKLQAIRDALRRIEALPFVQQTNSLFTARRVQSLDGYLTTSPYLKQIPATPEQAEVIRSEALKNPFIARNLLSPDGTAMALVVYLRGESKDPGFDRRVSDAIDDALAPLSGTIRTVFQVGAPYVRNLITERIEQDRRLILPMSLVVLLLTLALTLRRLSAALIPTLTAGLSIVWTLGLMAALDVPLNVMTSIVPALLIIIGSTEDIHLLAEYQAGVRHGLARRDAIAAMGRNMGTAVLLTFITTYLGFVSIALNDIGLLQQFGLISSTGLLFNFVITVALVPVALRFIGETSGEKLTREQSGIYDGFAEWLFQLVMSNKRAIAFLMGAATVVAGVGALSLRVNNNTMDYFGRDSQIVARANILHERLAGMQSFSIVLSSGIENTFLNVRYLKELQKLQAYLAKTGLFDKSLSFADYIALVNGIMEDGKPGRVFLPSSDDVVREYMAFIKYAEVRDYVSRDFSEARIVVRHNINSSYDLGQALDGIRAFAAKNVDPGLKVEITGESILTNLATDHMAYGQAQSLLLMILVIFLIISLLFVNGKAGLIAVVPNTFPIIVLFGVMGYAGIALDTGTAMVAAIALGICVDDTMHFMVRYQAQTQAHGDQVVAVRETIHEEAGPIVATSLALALGFGVFALSSFPPVAHFGVLSAMVMLVSLLSTFVVTPVLLSYTRLITVWDILSLRLHSEVVEKCALFRGMRPWQIKKAILVSDVRRIGPGCAIVTQGTAGREMFVLLAGTAEVWQNGPDGSRVKVVKLLPGDVFGEIALVSDLPRTADVIATAASQVLALEWDGIRRVAKHFPRIASAVFLNLSSIIGARLARADLRAVLVRDDLTGLVSRTYFNDLLGHEIAHAIRFEEPLSLILARVEGPGSDTDAEREVGDAVLKEFADGMARLTRKVDVFARWGGSTFAILLPRTEPANARVIIERVRTVVAAVAQDHAPGVEVRVGLAQFRKGDDVHDIMWRAEDALAQGRIALSQQSRQHP